MLKRNLIKIIIPLATVIALATTISVLPALAAPRNQTLQTVQGTVTGVNTPDRSGYSDWCDWRDRS